MRNIEPPIIEQWTYDGFPETIELEGTTFHRAIRKQPYEGVIEQYREMVPRQSMHLLVMGDGRWVIDHVDEYNPDMGHPVRHFLVDHPRGKSVLVAGFGVLGVLGSALVGLGEENNAKKTSSPNPGERNSGPG